MNDISTFLYNDVITCKPVRAVAGYIQGTGVKISESRGLFVDCEAGVLILISRF